jgi:capsular polysaccharide biosynthesis protein
MKVTRKGTNITVQFSEALIRKVLLIVIAALAIVAASARFGLYVQTDRCQEWKHVASSLAHSVPNAQVDDIKDCWG